MIYISVCILRCAEEKRRALFFFFKLGDKCIEKKIEGEDDATCDTYVLRSDWQKLLVAFACVFTRSVNVRAKMLILWYTCECVCMYSTHREGIQREGEWRRQR